MVEMHKFVLYPLENVFESFLVHFWILLHFCILLFLEKHSIASHQLFYRCFWNYSPNKPFYSNSRFAGSHFEVLFGDHFWIFSLNSWELFPIVSFEVLCKCLLHYSNIHCGKRNFIELFFCFENYVVFLGLFRVYSSLLWGTSNNLLMFCMNILVFL